LESSLFILVSAKNILLFDKIELEFVQNLLTKVVVARVLCNVGKVDVLINFINFLNDNASQIERSLESTQVFSWKDCKPLLP